jgi:hypothetical protein
VATSSKSRNGREAATKQSFEATLWAAADKLRGNMDAAEYKHVALGLIFLKYISDRFEERRTRALADPEEAPLVDERDLAEEVFVDAAEHVLAVVLVLESEVGEQFDDLTEPDLVEFRPGVILGQHAFEAWVLGLKQQHSLVEKLTNRRLHARGVGLDEILPRPVGHPEDVVADIEVSFVDYLGIGYPPDLQRAAVDLVILQAERLAGAWA